MSGNANIFHLPSIIQPLLDPLFEKKKVKVFAKRDDLIHPVISGNKYRKLMYQPYVESTPILTYGGAFSNHILATACYGYLKKIPTVGIIRGEEHLPLNPSLNKAVSFGMHLHYVSRSAYKRKSTHTFIKHLRKEFGDFISIPEGGSNAMGVKGTMEIIHEIPIPFDYTISAIGTGTTLAGMALASEAHHKHIGIPVLKNGMYLLDEIKRLQADFIQSAKDPKASAAIQLVDGYHHGGYAKISSELVLFMRSFYQKHKIYTDAVYSGKSAFALYDLLKKDFFSKESTILWYHCGGIQGNQGIEERYSTTIF
jgi:1-aminocyclopropane-1-carboxylate deaminase